jgi:tRNA1Val (adenine37-N6)-methyltransferase
MSKKSADTSSRRRTVATAQSLAGERAPGGRVNDGELGSASETMDALFQGKLRFYQSEKGHRFSLDSILLAYFVSLRRSDRVADLGTGNGVIALILAYLDPSLKITAVEVQREMANYAFRNVRLNCLEEKVQIVHGDVQRIEAVAEPESYDVVVCNPPYRKATSGRVSPDEERKIARHEVRATLRDFLRAAAYLLPAKGRMSLIYPSIRCVDLLQAMRETRIEPKRLQMVHSFADAEASLVLTQGVKAGKSGIEVMPPLVVYQTDRSYTDEVARMLEGSR